MNNIMLSKRSRTDINILSNLLNRNGIGNKIINTPMSLHLSCGLSVLIDENNFDKARAVCNQNGIRFDSVYRVIQSPYGSKYQKLQ